MNAIAENAFSPLINDEAESALLSSIMSNNRLIDTASELITADDFGMPVLGRIFASIVQLNVQGRAANPVTLKPIYENDPDLEPFGGMSFLTNLTGNVAFYNVRSLAEQIAELAKRRRLLVEIELARAELLEFSTEEDSAAIMSRLESAISAEDGKSDGVVESTAAQAFEAMMAGYERPKHGVTCHVIETLDMVAGPVRAGQMAILGGRPGMGKSAVALSYARGAAKAGHGVLFISLEMNEEELMQRMVADASFDGQQGIFYNVMRDGPMREPRWLRDKIWNIGGELKALPLTIVAAGSMKIGRLSSLIRRHQRRFEALGQTLDLVVIDYLQLLSPDRKTNSTYEAVSDVSRAIKGMAMRYRVGIMALAQLSRTVEQRTDKRPVLSDLRDSGQIEQDADTIIFAYRDAYYLAQSEPDQHDPKWIEWKQGMEVLEHRLDLIVAKRRNGTTGTAKAQFYGAFQAVRGQA